MFGIQINSSITVEQSRIGDLITISAHASRHAMSRWNELPVTEIGVIIGKTLDEHNVPRYTAWFPSYNAQISNLYPWEINVI